MRKLALLSIAAVTLCWQASAQQVLPAINLHSPASSAESSEWQRVKKSDDVVHLRAFEARYPHGRYTTQVQRRIAQLEREARARGEATNETLATSEESRLVEVPDSKLRGAVVRVQPVKADTLK